MVTRRGKGFTLIELLVVIAIIAILAAMLFPVFARARESARKIQCLSNVKNIALAINMYLTDYDRFPPTEHRQDVSDFVYTQPGGGPNECRIGESGERVTWMMYLMNPYIRWPVVLDEYVKNRDVWQCSSAKMVEGASFILPGPDWLGYLKAHVGQWGDALENGPCYHMTFPSGWGGSVTDSIRQQQNAGINSRYGALPGAQGTFTTGLATGEENFLDVKVSALQDMAAVPIVADGGVTPTWLSIATVAYPDICCAECAGLQNYEWGFPSLDCPDGSYCGDCFAAHATPRWAIDQKAKVASTRHLGGSNVGFGDGHARWFPAQAFLAASDAKQFEYIGAICGPYTSSQGHARLCGIQPGETFLYSREQDWYGK